MKIYVIGLNYKTTPIEIREKFSVNGEEYGEILRGLKGLEGVTECALLSTCNRTELHIYSENMQLETVKIEDCFCRMKGMDIYQIKKYFYVYEGINAIHHIIKVAAGMDSMLLGEDQILGQFKRAYEISIKHGTSRAVLNTLSRLAVTSSKKIKTRNLLLGRAASFAAQAGQLLELLYEDLVLRHVLIIGSGEIAGTVVNRLFEMGVENISMTTRDKAHIGKNLNLNRSIRLIDYNDRYEHIKDSDIVIGATSSPHYTVTLDMLEANMKDPGKKHVFIDMAVPRDFDEAISNLGNVELFNIDQLKEFSRVKKSQFSFDYEYIDAQIDNHTEEFLRWFRNRCSFKGIKTIPAVNLGG